MKKLTTQELIDRMYDAIEETSCTEGTGLYRLATESSGLDLHPDELDGMRVLPEHLVPGPVRDAYTKFYEHAQKLLELESDVMAAIRTYNIV